MAYAFRCRNCGTLETAGQAAELAHPAACRVCGSGVSFSPTDGTKQFHPDNWEVLADASAKDLAAIGLGADDVEVHVPWTPGATGPEVPTA